MTNKTAVITMDDPTASKQLISHIAWIPVEADAGTHSHFRDHGGGAVLFRWSVVSREHWEEYVAAGQPSNGRQS